MPAYSGGVPSASPVHSVTASPSPYMRPLAYSPLDSGLSSGAGISGFKRRRGSETLHHETSRRKH
ncbi:hypothetical protein F5Y17DRAFT_453287 [Xylariaceae sp. FL0594]|nr:hypothetical protein F5Y17DRAFT_453287 [Xylariaceae sp. FL0594]